MRVHAPLERLLQERIRVTETGCWEWLRSRTPEGYGRWVVDGRERKAHRVAYELYVGSIPDGLELDHVCRNCACCNPAHLEPVTHRENLLRGNSPSAQAARKTHCSNGHEFDDANTRIGRSGRRECRACERERSRRKRAAATEADREKAREANRRSRARDPEKTRERARIAASAQRATPEGRAAYNAYMREYHRRMRAAARA